MGGPDSALALLYPHLIYGNLSLDKIEKCVIMIPVEVVPRLVDMVDRLGLTTILLSCKDIAYHKTAMLSSCYGIINLGLCIHFLSKGKDYLSQKGQILIYIIFR